MHHLDHFDDERLDAWQILGFRAASQVLCVSRLWRDTLAAQYGIDASLVSNGVDMLRYTHHPGQGDAMLRQRLRLGPGPVFLAVGGVEPRKNTVGILDAFLRVRHTLPQAQLVVAGGASLLDHSHYQQQFRQRAAAAGLPAGAALQLLGRVADDDMPGLYRCADALVFPSLREGFGLAVLEAMACGTPAVVSRIAPFTEYLAPDCCAWANPTDAASIAAAMLQACDPQEARAMHAAGLALSAQFGWFQSATRHLGLYHTYLTHANQGANHA